MKLFDLKKVYYLSLTFLTLISLGCSSTKPGVSIENNRPHLSLLYCDSFMIYTMCAEDLNRDGEVDLFFFEDDDQIFFYRKGYLKNIITSHLFHPCMREMTNDLVKLGSRLFLIKKDADFVYKIAIQTKLIAFYISYLPVINSCQEANEIENNDENSFDYEEFF
ncbi:MAG: hypothetical protein P8J18_10465 [Halieaceae bacterium]|nr:hypothetical protein [Halieaceae bacterium]